MPKKMIINDPISQAASILGSIKTKKKSENSARIGRTYGGRNKLCDHYFGGKLKCVHCGKYLTQFSAKFIEQVKNGQVSKS